MFTTLTYQYRDGSNYKEHSTIILDGQLSAADIDAIKLTLEDESYFIPHDLDLDIEELQSKMTSFPSDDDHVYHELLIDHPDVSETVEEGASTIDAADFVNAFKKVKASGGWKIVEASQRLGIF